MFLANSLNSKLQKSLSELDLTNERKAKFPYQPKPKNPNVLVVLKQEKKDTSEDLANMTKEEFMNKFTLARLRSKFGRKFQKNFDSTHRKFPEYCASERAKTAKAYVKNILDKNLFENKQRKWNVSTKPDDTNFHPPLKQTLFEVTHGLKEFPVVPLKEQKIEPGIDVKYEVIDRNETYWKNSTKLESIEKKEIEKENIDKAFANTQKYWRRTESARQNQVEMPIVEERRKVEEPRYYKQYKSPRVLSAYNYDMMNHVKKILWIEREKETKQVIHDNPGCEVKEKINALVNKKMDNKYKDKFDILTGKKKEKKVENKKYDWKDEEIIKKIESLSDWKDTKWFDKICVDFNNQKDLGLTTMNDDKKKQLLMKPLICKGLDIVKEENKIKEEKIMEYKKKLRLETIKRKTQCISAYEGNKESDLRKVSKYPMDKFMFENQDLLKDKAKFRNTTSEFYGGDNNNTFNLYNTFNDKTTEIPNNEPKTNNDAYFLEAYKNILIREEEEKKKQKRIESHKRNKQWIEYKYFHPGKYREFESTQSKTTEDNKINSNSGGSQDKKITEKFMAWSCCMNTYKDSRGCRKQKINKHRWNLDHF